MSKFVFFVLAIVLVAGALTSADECKTHGEACGPCCEGLKCHSILGRCVIPITSAELKEAKENLRPVGPRD